MTEKLTAGLKPEYYIQDQVNIFHHRISFLKMFLASVNEI